MLITVYVLTMLAAALTFMFGVSKEDGPTMAWSSLALVLLSGIVTAHDLLS